MENFMEMIKLDIPFNSAQMTSLAAIIVPTLVVWPQLDAF